MTARNARAGRAPRIVRLALSLAVAALVSAAATAPQSSLPVEAAPAAAPPAADPTPDAAAEAIFLRAKAVWRARTEPPFVSFAILARYSKGSKTWDNWWQASYRGSDQRLAVHRIVVFDDEAKRLKGVPIDLFGVKIADTNPNADITEVDDPYISPSSSFGVTARRGEVLPKLVRAEEPTAPPQLPEGPRDLATPSPSPEPSDSPAPLGTPLEEIGHVSATARDYIVRLAGIERLRYGDAYHLTLVPTGDPKQYRLRDLWVKTDTYETLESTIQGLYDGKPYDAVRWTVSYVPIEGRFYVAQVLADEPLRFGITNVDGFEFDFVDYHFPSEIPNYTFEKTL